MAKKILLLLAAVCLLLTGCAQKNKPEDISQTVEASSDMSAELQTEAVSKKTSIELPPIPLTTAAGPTQKTSTEAQNTASSTPTQDPSGAGATKPVTTVTASTSTTAPKSSALSASTTNSPAATTTKSAAATTTKPSVTTTKVPSVTSTTAAKTTTTTTTAASNAASNPSATTTTAADHPSETLPIVGNDSERFELPVASFQ